MPALTETPHPVTGAPRLILQAEGLAVLAAVTVAYAVTGGSWLLFAVLFFTPDLFMLGYLRNTRTGAAVYNFGHSYVTTLAVVALGYGLVMPVVTGIGLIWTGHVGFDRMLGYGLKYPHDFKASHLTDGVKK